MVSQCSAQALIKAYGANRKMKMHQGIWSILEALTTWVSSKSICICEFTGSGPLPRNYKVKRFGEKERERQRGGHKEGETKRERQRGRDKEGETKGERQRGRD